MELLDPFQVIGVVTVVNIFAALSGVLFFEGNGIGT